MKIKAFTLIILTCSCILARSQENPKLDKEAIIQRAESPEATADDLRLAEKYYKKGIYDNAIKYYLNAYNYAQGISALNYKMAICCLYSTHPKSALPYISQAFPDVATDYYYQLGRAYQYNLMYDSAKVAYENYGNTLKSFKKKHFNKELEQLSKECDFGKTAIADSLPLFIQNMGPVINSYYDDYNAALSFQNDTLMMFTSRRPRKDKDKMVKRTRFKERILMTNSLHNYITDAVNEPSALRQTTHSSVAGIDNKDNRIYFYQGKWRHGNLYTGNITDGKVKKVRQLKGKINHRAHQETAFTIDENGNAYFVSDRTKGKGGKDIYSATKRGKYRFGNVKNLGSLINTSHDEEGVFVTADGNTLYFASNGHSGMGGFDIYKTTKNEMGTWNEPVNMGYPINSPADELFYRTTPDSMIAIYSTLREGSFGGLDIYRIQKDPSIPFELNGSVTDKKNGKFIPATISVYQDSDNTLVASAPQDTITGKYALSFEDIGNYWLQVEAPGYVSTKDTLKKATYRFEKITQNYQLAQVKHPFTLWGKITNKETGAPVLADIVFKAIDKDTILYRTASNAVTGDYTITFEDKMNVLMVVSATDYFGYNNQVMMKSLKADKEERNITLTSSIVVAPVVPGKISYTLTGVLSEQETKTPVAGWVKVYKPGVVAPIAIAASDSATGKYTASMDDPAAYVIEVTAEGYFFLNSAVSFKKDSTLQVKNYELQKMKAGVKIVIEHILFVSGKSTLQKSSFAELDKFATLLIENPKVRVEISGHTDNVGSAESNKKLSKARALTVRDYLIKKGVSASNLEYEGYGMEQPVAPNDTKEGKAQNRRVEVKILD